jgi:hypothetical protein
VCWAMGTTRDLAEHHAPSVAPPAQDEILEFVLIVSNTPANRQAAPPASTA